VSKAKIDHEKFWALSWFQIGLYIDGFLFDQEAIKNREEQAWARFRIGWADFGNANRGKKGKIRRPQDLIKLSFDVQADTERLAKYHEIDLDAVRRKLGTKIKKKRGKQ